MAATDWPCTRQWRHRIHPELLLPVYRPNAFLFVLFLDFRRLHGLRKGQCQRVAVVRRGPGRASAGLSISAPVPYTLHRVGGRGLKQPPRLGIAKGRVLTGWIVRIPVTLDPTKPWDIGGDRYPLTVTATYHVAGENQPRTFSARAAIDAQVSSAIYEMDFAASILPLFCIGCALVRWRRTR